MIVVAYNLNNYESYSGGTAASGLERNDVKEQLEVRAATTKAKVICRRSDRQKDWLVPKNSRRINITHAEISMSLFFAKNKRQNIFILIIFVILDQVSQVY